MTLEKSKTKLELKKKRTRRTISELKERLVAKSPIFKCKFCSKVCKYMDHHIRNNHLEEYEKDPSKRSFLEIRKECAALCEELEKEKENVIQLSPEKNTNLNEDFNQEAKNAKNQIGNKFVNTNQDFEKVFNEVMAIFQII